MKAYIAALLDELIFSGELMAIADAFPDVNEEILEKFLALVRDRYPLADKANYFLETKEKQSGINIAITNQRDVLSHLVTLLTPGLSVDGQTAQLYTAEEHLRRAILESYETALNRRLDKLSGVIPTIQKMWYRGWATLIAIRACRLPLIMRK